MNNHLLQKAIEEQRQHYNRWADTLNNFGDLTFRGLSSTEEEFGKAHYETAGVLLEIQRFAIRVANIKNEWAKGTFTIGNWGLETQMESVKGNFLFEFGISVNGLHLETWLKYAENLKHMDDSFWRQFLSLDDYGNFEVLQTSLIGDEGKESMALFNTKRSHLFKLLRNYLLFKIYHGDTDGIGRLKISWTFDLPFDKLLESFANGFKIFYNLNYLLWKTEYQKRN